MKTKTKKSVLACLLLAGSLGLCQAGSFLSNLANIGGALGGLGGMGRGVAVQNSPPGGNTINGANFRAELKDSVLSAGMRSAIDAAGASVSKTRANNVNVDTRVKGLIATTGLDSRIRAGWFDF